MIMDRFVETDFVSTSSVNRAFSKFILIFYQLKKPPAYVKKLICLIFDCHLPRSRGRSGFRPPPRLQPKEGFYLTLRLMNGSGLIFTFPEIGEGVTAVTDEVDTKAVSTKRSVLLVGQPHPSGFACHLPRSRGRSGFRAFPPPTPERTVITIQTDGAQIPFQKHYLNISEKRL